MNSFIKADGVNTDITAKRCPICGHQARLEVESMDRGNGHGYPGNFSYDINCSFCKVLLSTSCTDIWTSKTKAIENATASWNKQVDEIEELLRWRNKK